MRAHASCSDPEGGPENHKAIGFLINTGPDPMENHKATKPAFNVEPSSARLRNGVSLLCHDGPLLVVFESSPSSST